MSSDTSSESNLRSLFETALREYEKQAGTNLLDNHLTIKLQSCNSADAVSAILQEHAQAFHMFRGDDGKAIKWLKRTVHVLHMLSTSNAFSEGVGLVRLKLSALNYIALQASFLTYFIQPFPPAKAIFAGIGILLAVCTILSFTRPRGPRLINVYYVQAIKDVSATSGNLPVLSDRLAIT